MSVRLPKGQPVEIARWDVVPRFLSFRGPITRLWMQLVLVRSECPKSMRNVPMVQMTVR